MTPEQIIIDFRSPDEAKRWEIINDGVMGGISKGILLMTSDKTAIFEGNISLENYGGFASIRTYPQDYQLDSFDGLIVNVKGDGKRYRLRLRTDDEFDGIAYQATFLTKSEIRTTVHLPFRDFIPVYRGRIVTDAPPLNPAHIKRLGFMIADKQAGPFRLEIEWVKAYVEKQA
jgi:NADH dehydrogenase [ubiquinone] 1 alpha subcomplex assembly factor 1